ncbi:gamma-aminobutyric acid receptor subunit beta-2 isoform X1 [Hydra vulgaris]|uniref:gamma-aminobutyric acid receptor subunit beta-2 isoform X1 n=1 Tax=Hydra vulgaris TaxID=6087 RepID=UPI001F5F116D|nr:gamma-aminobutyric acid receptor subunit beta-2 [Hydra vulgaris]
MIFFIRTHALFHILVVLNIIPGSICINHEKDLRDEDVDKTWKVLMNGYDKAIRPNYTGDATMINLDMTVMRFGKLDEVNMMFTLDLFLRQEWIDYRLRHNLPEILTPNLGHDSPPDFIWTPDTVFLNAQKASSHSVTVKNSKLDIYPDGKVFWGLRVSVEANCLFDLRNYPMDTQACDLGIVSYGYTIDHLLYRWRNDPIQILNQNLSQYTLTGIENKTIVEQFSMGKFALLKAEFTFKRRIAFSILQIFFPCVAIVCVSWISLWLHKHCSPARVGIGVTTLLTISTIWGSVNRRLPNVSYVKAVDIYFMASFSFIFMTLIEYTIVLNGLKNFKKKFVMKNAYKEISKLSKRVSISLSIDKVKMPNMRRYSEPCRSSTSIIARYQRKSENSFLLDDANLSCNQISQKFYEEEFSEEEDILLLSKKEVAEKHPAFMKLYLELRKASIVDKISRILFPLLFICFNIFYWLKYNDNASPNKN